MIERKNLIEWLLGGRYNVEAYMFLLHRITGIGLALYLPLHILVTSSRTFGPEAWKNAMSRVAESPIVHLLEWVLVVGIAIHGLNGLRLIFTELGFFIGRPSKPVYPYTASIHRQRLILGIVQVIIAIFVIYSLIIFAPKMV